MLVCAKLDLSSCPSSGTGMASPIGSNATTIITTESYQETEQPIGQSANRQQQPTRIRRNVHVTDSMITSLIQACVVASRQRSRNKGIHLSPAQEEQEAALRRIPLDTALQVLTTIQASHNIPLVTRHVNPLAAAYQSLGYLSQATEILVTMLSNRTAGEEPEDGVDILNVYDLCARDKGSYSLLVQGAVVAGDWGAAVEALSDMTEAGLYPKQRHCNLWSEISERKTRPRATGSWKKKRDDYWAESVR